jgi:hypothetical protein
MKAGMHSLLYANFTLTKLKNDARHKRKRYYKVGDGNSGLGSGVLSFVGI